MTPDPRFNSQPSSFWATVQFVSTELGYSVPRQSLQHDLKEIRSYSIGQIQRCHRTHGLSTEMLFSQESNQATEFGNLLVAYFEIRKQLLTQVVEPNLMDRECARLEFERLRTRLKPSCPLPMNKQRGDKRHHAYLTCIVNMLTEQVLGSNAFDADPQQVIRITNDRNLLYTGYRRMDGAFPSIFDPIAIWELKEYYGTTTFGSRVADAVYLTKLDGYEMVQLRTESGYHIRHYLIVDDHYTWWECGASYLCRIIDMLHMGLLDEVLFGREVLDRWPKIVEEWLND